jgi:hypothetical protein
MRFDPGISASSTTRTPPRPAWPAAPHRERAFVDATQFDPSSRYFDARAITVAPRWWTIEVEFVERFVELVPLATMRRTAALEGMMVLARGRGLSIQPVREAHFRLVLRLAGRGRSCRDARRHGVALQPVRSPGRRR